MLSLGIFLVLYIEKSKTDQYWNGSEVLISKGTTSACPYLMFLRNKSLAEVNLDSDFFLFRPIFRSKGVCKLIYKNKKNQLHFGKGENFFSTEAGIQ